MAQSLSIDPELSERISRLTADEQRNLADWIYDHLPVDPEIEAAWGAEGERRYAEYRAGRDQAIPLSEVMAKYGRREPEPR